MSVSFDLELGAEIRQAAAREKKSVSAWLAEAANNRLRNDALADALNMWEDEFGPITEEELAEAEKLFARARKLARGEDA